jgi:outer membrane protein assembly factor BamB
MICKARVLFCCLVVAFLSAGCDMLTGIGTDNTPKAPALLPITPEYAVKPLWNMEVGSSSSNVDVNLLVANVSNRLFTADPNGLVSAHLLETGKPLWQIQTKTQLSSGPVANQGYVIVATNDGRIIALNEQNGAKRWQTTVPNQVLAAPNIDRDHVYVKTIDGKLLALRLSDGRILWTYNHGAPLFILRGSSAPQAAGSSVIAGFADGKLSSYDKQNGKLLWERSIAVPNGSSEVERMVDIDADPVVTRDVAYTATYQGNLAAIEVQSGQVRWQHNLSTHRALAISSNQLFASDTHGDIWAFDQQSGAVIWRQTRLEQRGITAPVVMGDHVVVGDLEGYLHWFSREDGHPQARIFIDKSGISATPIAVGNRLVVLTREGSLVAMQIVR